MTFTQIIVYVCLASFVYGLTGGAFARKYPDSLFAKVYRLPKMLRVFWDLGGLICRIFVPLLWWYSARIVSCGYRHFVLRRKDATKIDNVMVVVVQLVGQARHLTYCPDCQKGLLNEPQPPSGPYAPGQPTARVHEPAWHRDPARDN